MWRCKFFTIATTTIATVYPCRARHSQRLCPFALSKGAQAPLEQQRSPLPMNRFINADRRDSAYLLPPSVDEWLPEDHLVRFVVEVIEQMDMSEFTRQYAGRDSAAHHPTVLLALLIYGYASGVHSRHLRFTGLSLRGRQHPAERHAIEQQEYEARMARHQAHRDAGKKPRGKALSRHKAARWTKTRSTSRTKSHASCPSRAGVSSKATTRRRRWTRTRYWWSAPMSVRRAMTNVKSSRRWSESKRCPRQWVKSTPCWATTATAAKPTSNNWLTLR